MADKIRVLLTEEEVDRRINEVAEEDKQGLCGKGDSPDLYIKRRCIFYL